ncbi:Histone-lysine N-methyltransferase SETMAR, partial [Dufourea novaeangliae]
LVNRKGVVFHQDNAKPHTAKRTLAKLKELKWDAILHPPYSPDIALLDYYLFRSLQNDLNGKKFASLEAVKNHISSFFNSKPKSFYDRGIRMLPERWEKIVENNGNYIID